MGDLQQLDFVRRHRAGLDGPVLEIGAKDYGNTPSFRPLFEGMEYVGLDMADGPGVDQVLDMTRDFAEVDSALDERRFGTIFCLSVLEHCRDPFKMCANITRLLAPGGTLLVSVPFSWERHGYPSDYWRFTPDGVKVLFPELAFDDGHSQVHTTREGDARPVDDDLGAVFFSTKRARTEGRFGRFATILFLRALKAVGIGRWLLDYSKVFPPVMVDMVGTLPRTAPRPNSGTPEA